MSEHLMDSSYLLAAKWCWRWNEERRKRIRYEKALGQIAEPRGYGSSDQYRADDLRIARRALAK